MKGEKASVRESYGVLKERKEEAGKGGSDREKEIELPDVRKVENRRK